ncbi:MAG: hypothetical protein GX896_07915 [Clostridiales bacterium]|nr:hypothetical protein [Clostridiales bacterium]
MAVFTPADTDNYNTIEKALTVVVIKADPSLTIPTGLEATYGDTLSDVKLSDWTGWTWKDSTQSVGNVSETGNKFVAVFTPENENYNPIEKELPVIVKPLELTDALAISEDVTYTGEKQEPKVTVTLGDITLIDEVDYVVTYGDETDVGNGTYTVTFKGNYSGTIDGSYNIEATKAMEDFEEELNKLPNEIKTKEDAEKVDEVKELYNNLTDGEKLQLSDDVVIKYDNALAAAKEFNDIDNSDSNGDSSGDSNNSNGDSDSSNSKDNSKNPSPNTGATLRLTACAMIMLAGVILATISSKRKKKN